MTSTSLTQPILDKGVVLVYVKPSSTAYPDAVLQLPFSEQALDASFYFIANIGSLTAAYFKTSDPNVDPGNIGNYYAVRYILIPGGVAATSALLNGAPRAGLADRLQSMPYPDVCRLLGIPE